MLTGLMEAPLAVLGDRAPEPNQCGTAWSAPLPTTRTSATARGCGSPKRSCTAPACPATARKTRECRGWPSTTVTTTSTSSQRWPGRTADGPHLHNDYYRLGEALRAMEAEYGLVVVARADRTAAKRPTRAEQEKAAQAEPEPARVTLQRQVAAAAAGARSEPEFFAALDKRGLRVRLRHSARNPGEVTGYAVGLPGDVTAAGEQIWFGGGKLAPDLTLPKLRQRWPEPARRATPASRPGRRRAAAAGRARDDRRVGPRSAAPRGEHVRGRRPVRAGFLRRAGRGRAAGPAAATARPSRPR